MPWSYSPRICEICCCCPRCAGKRVLAFDPGFKSGCKLAALDEFGNLLDQAVVHLVGKEERKAEGRAKLVR